jgi:oxygen-independent coproporphyrinogen-3 oxidase
LQTGLPAEKQHLTLTTMAGIYIHIPFCKQACHYCNFHFATSLRQKNELVTALLKEIELQKSYLEGENIETIYFGGGTPSLLQISDLRLQIDQIYQCFQIEPGAEITLEANPDDIEEEKLSAWKKVGINRLSIGVQSFFDDELKWMNRAHNAMQAVDSLQLAVKEFTNITIDLIYGTPLSTNEKWKQNVETAFDFEIPHLSCYALTVEQKTPLYKMIRDKKSENINPDLQSEQFLLLMQWMNEGGYEHYEISNFCKPGYHSRHNSSYWQGKKYLGIGPSAHSYDGKSRQWNVSNNNKYIDSLEKNIVPFEKEILTPEQKLNEYIMTSLRTKEGLHLNKAEEQYRKKIETISKKFVDSGLMRNENDHLILTNEGKLLADGIAAALFI